MIAIGLKEEELGCAFQVYFESVVSEIKRQQGTIFD